MKTLKPLIYSIHSKAKSTLDTCPSKSQLYELVAAYLNKKSYAALSEMNFKSSIDEAIHAPSKAINNCLSRAKLLGINNDIAEIVVSIISMELTNSAPKISATELNWLAIERFSEDEANSSSDNLLDQLRQCADEGNKESKLLLLLWLCHEQQKYIDFRGSKYWYEQKASGKALPEEQNKWADNYQRYAQIKTQLDELIRNNSAEDLAVPDTDAMLHSGDVSPLNQQPLYRLRAIDAIETIFSTYPEVEDENPRITLSWLKLEALQCPNRSSIEDIIEHLTDVTEIHAWAEFAQTHGIDLTTDDYTAIDTNTGEVWDADHDAPIDIFGYGAITLPTLPEKDHLAVEQQLDTMKKIYKFYS
ncbi:hypothetical protein [Shewanella dokdonensis]|uniref:Uncharacterized protein n=1 Tax=Shewanella dokdonensis TaxID=712036 RepID=A0ABX8DGH2_9GAMM|nr:hypothetical protein [Shewanella dokdonensis]MCL1073970.1 hypothetical protein [Shewanella dokdonensis]QVK23731.1 hypothetical protein KHX94_03240 [Shewanella dokdonensis]